MGQGTAPGSVALIAAMVTPALLIVGAASLVASALVRMGRVVDRTRVLAAAIQTRETDRLEIDGEPLRRWLERHATRARHAERSIVCLYGSVVVFVATCLSIAIDRLRGDSSGWLAAVLAVTGTLLLLAGGTFMVAESRLSARQISEEIDLALSHLEEVQR